MSIVSKRGVEEKKNAFYNLEKLILLLYYNHSFASAVQRRIEELKLALA
jgi:hypothetical protein